MANIHRGYNILVCEVCTVYCLYTLQCDSVKRGQLLLCKTRGCFCPNCADKTLFCWRGTSVFFVQYFVITCICSNACMLCINQIFKLC